MTLGETIRYLRQQLGMSLRALAKATGINRTLLSEAERDFASLTDAEVEKIAKELDVDKDALYDVSDIRYPTDKELDDTEDIF